MYTVYIKSRIVSSHKISQGKIAILRETSLKRVEVFTYMIDLQFYVHFVYLFGVYGCL